MCRFVVYMNESSFNIRKDFNLVLQLLADIVRFPKRSIRVHHDVNFDKIVLRSRVKFDFRVSLLDGRPTGPL